MKQFRFMAFVAIVLAAASFTTYAATTFVGTQGNYGNERCLVGAGGICSGGAYNNSLSMVSIFQNGLGACNTLVRFDDSFDKLGMNTVTNGGQIQALARYAGDNSTFGYDAWRNLRNTAVLRVRYAGARWQWDPGYEFDAAS